MKIYAALPAELLEGWNSRVQTHPALQRVHDHYHDTDEWLEVLRGEMTFYAISGDDWRLRSGDVFHIPRGEVHHVEIGPAGVEYRMYAQMAIESGFSRSLSADELTMLRTNIEFPFREENTDGVAGEFFEKTLSDALVFVRADCSVVAKETFTAGFTARGRASAGTVCVLNRTDNGVLLSTTVTVGQGAAQKAFLNVRLFAKEADAWKCRVWVNYPQPR